MLALPVSMPSFSTLPALSIALALSACAIAPATRGAPTHIGGLRLLGSAVLTRTESGVLRDFGGISGADFDPATGVWYLLPDDRSEHAPARIYTARIAVGPQGIGAIDVDGIVVLRQADGSTFPSPAQAGEVPDPEALRLDPAGGGGFFWSSEGDRKRGLSPFVRQADRTGAFVADVPLPANLRVHANEERGARDNLTIEGLAFADQGRTLWASMEAPLYEDGPVPTVDHGAFTRFTRIDGRSGSTAQYAYPVDAIPVAPSGGKRRADNGVSEILPTPSGSLLVIERSGREIADGVFGFEIRLYEADSAGATDVLAAPSLQHASFAAMRKRLVLDLGTLGYVDNIEAAAWGPTLPNGHATLVLMSDDNFSSRQVTQILAYEVMPG